MKENKLWYNAPASDWLEALPLGNGRLGMMVFGGVNEDQVQLNEESFWSGWEYSGFNNPKTAEHLEEMRRLIFERKYTEAQDLCNKYFTCRGEGNHDVAYGCYQTAGEIHLTIPNAAEKDYYRELRLDKGQVSVRCENSQREYFVSPGYNVGVIKVSGNTEGISLRYERENATIVHDDGRVFVLGYLPTKYAAEIRYQHTDDGFYVYFTAATNYKSDQDPEKVCTETLDRAINAGYDALLKDTNAYFDSMLNRAGFSLSEPETKSHIPTNERQQNPENDLGLFELYFNYGRYLLVASSSNCRLPANLQGIWCKDYQPKWNSDYHLNINIQMNYWPAEVCNLPELVTPFFEFIRSLAKVGEKSAKVTYGCPGWVIHFATNVWGYNALGCHTAYGAFLGAGAWCIRHIKERWLYSKDPAVLEEFYSLIKGASEFFCAYLVKDPNSGYLVTAPASSPENSFITPDTGSKASVCAGPTMDMSIIRELFEFNIEAAEVLGKDTEFTEKLKDLLPQLLPLQIGKHGQLMEWSEDFEESEPKHRHISHMYGLYPASEITESTPELYNAARKSIERRIANSFTDAGKGWSTIFVGWSLAWIINSYARFKEGNIAEDCLVRLFKNSTCPNLFDLHPPRIFQIDGNFGATAGMAEMLLQSHAGYIDILPALPDAWKDGEFFGLMARGGFKVSASWKDGKVVRCEIVGKEGTPFRVKYNGKMIEAVGSYSFAE